MSRLLPYIPVLIVLGMIVLIGLPMKHERLRRTPVTGITPTTNVRKNGLATGSTQRSDAARG